MDNLTEKYRYSIIIPHYNSAAGLLKLLESIPLSGGIQIIIVDDNSTDDIREAKNYIAKRKQCEFYVNHTGVQSAGACRNIGLRHAKGKWLLFADADDYFLEGFTDVTDKYYDSTYDVIFFVPHSVDLASKKRKPRHLIYQQMIHSYQNKPKRRNELLLKYRYYPPWSKMIRKKFLDAYQIDFEPVLVANDVMFSTRVAYNMDSFTTEVEPIYMVTRGKNTLTTLVNKERFMIRRDTFVRRCLFLRENLALRDWKSLNSNGAWYFNIITDNDLGWDIFMETYKIFRANNIKPFSLCSYKTYLLVKYILQKKFYRKHYNGEKTRE